MDAGGGRASSQSRREKKKGAAEQELREALRAKLQPGTPAKAAGPFGGFDYTHGGNDQIWIAGGIGITPFMSWIRSLDGDFDRDVELYYSVAHESDAFYLDEIQAATAAHQTLHVRVVNAERDGFLTAEKAAKGRPSGADVWVYMCGPPPMMKALAKGFRSPRANPPEPGREVHAVVRPLLVELHRR